jgi:hypothetical protein
MSTSENCDDVVEIDWTIALSGEWNPRARAILEFMRDAGRPVTQAMLESAVPGFVTEMLNGVNFGLRNRRGANCRVRVTSADRQEYEIVAELPHKK